MDEAFRSQGVDGVWNFMRDLDLVGGAKQNDEPGCRP